MVDAKKDWKKLTSIGMVKYQREENGNKTVEKRYFICSKEDNAEKFSHVVADKAEDARRFSENYKLFKENWSRIKALDEEISRLVAQIQSCFEVDVKEFVKKAGERRGRKQKKSNEGAEG